jgi:hypothetical protein
MNNPNDVTHIDDDGGRYSYLGENTYSVWMDNEKIPYWREMPHNNIECASNIRSVSDVKRIEELEKELNLTKDIIVAHQIADETGYIDGVGWVENWSEMEETVTKLVEAHNLVQQSNGCFEAISEINSQFVNGASFVLVRDVNNFGVKKQLQAKALKDKL